MSYFFNALMSASTCLISTGLRVQHMFKRWISFLAILKNLNLDFFKYFYIYNTTQYNTIQNKKGLLIFDAWLLVPASQRPALIPPLNSM